MTYYVEVIDNTYGGVLNPADPDDKWDRDDTYTDHNIRGIKVVGERAYHHLPVDFNPEDRDCYLLYVIYNTGDSFGCDEGLIEFVGLYKDRDIAEENARRIKEHYSIYRKLNARFGVTEKQRRLYQREYKHFNSFSVTLINEDQREYRIHVPWTGYFESVTDVGIERVNVL